MKAVLIVVIACGVLAIAACSNYDIFDSSGKLLVSGQTSALSQELPLGKYRIGIDARGQTLEEQLTIVPDKTTSMSLGVDSFFLRR